MLKHVHDIVYLADDISSTRMAQPWQDSDSLETPKEKLTVLVVDDHRLIADTLCDILETSGFHGVPAYDGEMALEVMNRLRPDYLLSDVLMPRMNGVELAISVRKAYPRTKILLFSGQAGISEILLEGQRQGYEFELMPKPIHPLKLIERLKTLE